MQAAASQITFNTLPTTYEDGTYNGFLGATIDGQLSSIVCDDYTHSTQVPSGPWTYQESVLSSLTYARFGNSAAAVKEYEAAALLLAGDGSTLAGLVNVTNPNTISAYQYALWALFDPSVASFGNSASLLNTAELDASSGTVYVAYAELRVYTPAGSAAGNQEFLGLVSTPEPGTAATMGIGLLLLAAFMGRKFKVRNSGAVGKLSGRVPAE
jgi:hypothetical protein